MSYCILIPTINRRDLLMPALQYYAENLPNTNLYIWDNGRQGIDKVSTRMTIWESETNLGVAASWNRLIQEAISRGETNFFILNDDIVYKKGEDVINQMIAKGSSNTFHRCRPAFNWSAYVLRKEIYQKVGSFDENFKRCYFEDNDYQYRMKLQGVEIRYEDDLTPDVYLNSQSIAKDPLLSNFIDNREYFVQKWGGAPESEIYKTPFNK